MGGIGIGMRSGSSVFFNNPASYSNIDTNTFVFDMGVDYGIIRLTNHQTHFKSDDIEFSHLIMAFPIRKGLGFAVGVVPFSTGYYKLAESVTKTSPGYDPIIGEYTSTHNGDGGFHNLFLGTGIKITSKLSLGINLSLLFGQLSRNYQIVFADYTNVYNNDATENLGIHGLNFNYGLQYTAPLKNDHFFNAGISASNGKNYKTNYHLLSYKYTAFNTRDTISYVADDSTRTFIPGTYGAGIAFGKINKFTAGLDFQYTKWSNSKIPGGAGYAADTKTLRIGLEYIPEKFANYSLLKRVEYRLGGHYGDSYLQINDQRIKEYGGSFGIGIPMRRTYSRTNIYFDYTRRSGSVPGSIHLEDYYTIGVSLNMVEAWFIKRKYD